LAVRRSRLVVVDGHGSVLSPHKEDHGERRILEQRADEEEVSCDCAAAALADNLER
jgi:hypothetical protein